MTDKERIEFVARHYRRGLFSTKAAWMMMGLGTQRRRVRWGIAASVAVILAVTASAALFLNRQFNVGEQNPPVEETVSTTVATAKALDFEGASLPTVISEIQTTFGVEIGGMPPDAANLKLTLHYEGDIETLITTINEILGTELYVENS